MNAPKTNNYQTARQLSDEEIERQREALGTGKREAVVEEKAREMLANGSMVVVNSEFGNIIVISEKS